MAFAKKRSKYWRGLVTGAMVGAGAALILAQRKRAEDAEYDAPDDDIEYEEVGGTSSGKDTPKDALDETLDSAKQAAQEVKSEVKDAWNKVLDEVKEPAADQEDLSKSSTNDN